MDSDDREKHILDMTEEDMISKGATLTNEKGKPEKMIFGEQLNNLTYNNGYNKALDIAEAYWKPRVKDLEDTILFMKGQLDYHRKHKAKEEK